jgi:protein TonB
MARTPEQPTGTLTLPASLGTSAIFHGVLVVSALLFFQASAEDLQPIEPPRATHLATLTLPPDFFKALKPPPEPIPEPPKEEEENIEEPEKVATAPPKQVKRKWRARKKAEAKPIKQPADVPKASEDTANTSPPTDETGDPTGISRTGDPKGTANPKALDKGPAMAGAKPNGVDLGALRKGYIRSFSRAVRRDYKYPMAARRARLQGVVLLEITIDAQGNIIAVAVAKSSGYSALDKAAVASVRKVGKLPAPPAELGWKRKKIRLPFKYKLKPS